MRIKNKRILEHTTSFTQETTSWVCGRPGVFQLEWEPLRLKRSEETADKESKNAFQAGSTQACRGGKANGLLKWIKPGAAASAY